MRRVGLAITVVVVGILIGLGAFPHNPIGWLARATVGQVDMLIGRVEIETAIEQDLVPTAHVDRLRGVAAMRAFGASELGLAATDNYGSYQPGWRRKIWNVSACEPLSFTPKRYWFPIVGSITYTGYFDEGLARDQASRLAARGYDTWARTAGAYSTLGWFQDPVLPHMLTWDEDRLAETLLHELAHATLWVEGHAGFNEAFANFVGERGALAWMASTHGRGSRAFRDTVERDQDQAAYRALLRQVVRDLEVVYADVDSPEADRLERKRAILASLPQRADAVLFHRPDRYRRLFEDPEWNNARLLQFRTYHRGQEAFASLLEAQDGDVARFIAELAATVERTDNPWAALSAATGVDTSE